MSGRGRGGARGRSRAVLPPSLQHAAFPSYASQLSASTVPSVGTGVPSATHVSPTPLFPDVSLPLPKEPSPDEGEIVSLYRRFERLVQQSPYHYRAKPPSPDIQRYSDRYQKQSGPLYRIHDIRADISCMSEELIALYKPEKAKSVAKLALPTRMPCQMLKLDQLEKREKEHLQMQTEGEQEVALYDAEEARVYEGEEYEEETDYNLNYFDPGEDDGDYEDDNEDGPVY